MSPSPRSGWGDTQAACPPCAEAVTPKATERAAHPAGRSDRQPVVAPAAALPRMPTACRVLSSATSPRPHTAARSSAPPAQTRGRRPGRLPGAHGDSGATTRCSIGPEAQLLTTVQRPVTAETGSGGSTLAAHCAAHPTHSSGACAGAAAVPAHRRESLSPGRHGEAPQQDTDACGPHGKAPKPSC